MPHADHPAAPPLRRRLLSRPTAIWFGLSLLAVAASAWRVPPGRIPLPTAPRPEPAAPAPATEVECRDLPAAGIPSHHAASLCADRAGRPVAFWFAGTKEGATDVRILRSVFDRGVWSEPRAVLTPADASRLAGRWIRKLGNPVTWRAPDGSLHLYVVTVCFGGWSGSRLLHLTSPDDGLTFLSGQPVVASPFFNLSTLVKSPGTQIGDGGVLPLYHEFVGKHSLLLQLDNDGSPVRIRRFCAQDNLIQPCLTRLASGEYLAVHRRLKKLQPRVYEQTSDDGLSWTPAKPGSLPNPRSAVALTTTPEGVPVIAFNDTESNRNLMRLAIRPAGGDWLRVGPQITSAGEVSYPSLLAAPDALHLVLTHDRARLKHYRIPYSVLSAPPPR